ncbi:MAG: alpha-L-rhamnosidase N-terminal domain-containing protein, partial [Mobilitalea sp.]
MMTIQGEVDNYYEQLGIDKRNPSFSWKITGMELESEYTAYRLMIAKSMEQLIWEEYLYDTGKVESKDHIGIQYSGEALDSVTKYCWKVVVWTSSSANKDSKEETRMDKKLESQVFSFVTGRLEEDASIGTWIMNGTAKPFYARKEWEISHEIKEAYALVSGLGQFYMRINGEKVSDHEFDPGWTYYDRKIQYVQYDIKEYLKKGNNAIGIEVGNGWYISETEERYYHSMPPKNPMYSFIPPNLNPYVPFSDCLALCGAFYIIYEDDTREILETNSEWMVRESATKLANVYGSEIYDAREYPAGWDRVNYEGRDWKKATPIDKDRRPKG